MRPALERLLAELAAVDSPRLGRESYQEGREDLADPVSTRLEAILAGRDDGPAIPPGRDATHARIRALRDEARRLGCGVCVCGSTYDAAHILTRLDDILAGRDE